jgi:hypothetical protein
VEKFNLSDPEKRHVVVSPNTNFPGKVVDTDDILQESEEVRNTLLGILLS